jgi:hypothetical protein
MRTSFHHQPEAQHPNFQLSTSWQADYPIYWRQSGHVGGPIGSARSRTHGVGLQFSGFAVV